MPNLACPSTELDFLQPSRFKLSIDRLPDVSFFVQSAEIPGVQLNSLESPNPLSNIQIPDSKLQFSPLNLTFIVDNKLNNWLEVFYWMQGLGFPEDWEQYRTESRNQRFADERMSDLARNCSNATLLLMGLDGSPTQTITFVDCFPTSLGGIPLDSTSTDVQYSTASLTLAYSYFKI